MIPESTVISPTSSFAWLYGSKGDDMTFVARNAHAVLLGSNHIHRSPVAHFHFEVMLFEPELSSWTRFVLDHPALSRFLLDSVLVIMFSTILFGMWYQWRMAFERLALKHRLKFDSVHRAHKAADSIFHVFYYIVAWLFGMYCVVHQWDIIMRSNWLYPIRSAMLWHRHHPYDVSIETRVLYMAQFAFYLQGFLVLLFGRDKRRVDHNAFLTHHVVTMFLIGASYALGWTRSGLAIFVLHDFSDIFLHLGKVGIIFRNSIISFASYASFLITYVVFRLWYYPQIVYSVWTDFDRVFTQSSRAEHLAFAISLTLLQVLHLIWFTLIVQSVRRTIQNSTIMDSRYESDVESDEVDASRRPRRPATSADMTSPGKTDNPVMISKAGSAEFAG